MAKTGICPICGKEIIYGILNGNVEELKLTADDYLDCCGDCKKEYKEIVKAAKPKFEAKLHNYKRRNKGKLDNDTLGKLFMTYLNEATLQMEKNSGQVPDNQRCFYVYNKDGYFNVREWKLGFLNKDISVTDMVKSTIKNSNTDGMMFTKDDITRIEFRRDKFPSSAGLFKYVASYDIRLNDESVMTAKPCITRIAIVTTATMFNAGSALDKKMTEILNDFKKVIGSDLPVVKVNKF